MLLPRRQRRRLVRRDQNHGRRRRRAGLLLAEESPASVEQRFEELQSRLGARKHVVGRTDAAKELGVGRRWNVGDVEVQSRLLGIDSR